MSNFCSSDDARSHSARDGVLVLAVTGSKDLRWGVLTKQEVDHVEEAAKVAIAILLARGDENSWHLGGNTNSVLDIEVLGTVY